MPVSTVILKETARKGVFLAHRREGEQAFAELHSPTARKVRTWGIKYRGPNALDPFGSPVFNVPANTKDDALYELNFVARVSSDAQLHLG